VVEASKDNPDFYVQYAHARIHSIMRKADAEGLSASADHLSLLGEEEQALVAMAAQFPRIVESAALSREPHRVAFYLGDLAAAFHAFFNLGNDRPDKRIVMTHDEQTSSARLFLVQNIGQVIANGLALMAVEAATQM